jgi:nucleoside-diphosphate-sugar epimerase
MEPRPGDVRHSLADINKAKKELGYNPKYNLDEGLVKTIEWFRNLLVAKRV